MYLWYRVLPKHVHIMCSVLVAKGRSGDFCFIAEELLVNISANVRSDSCSLTYRLLYVLAMFKIKKILHAD